MAMSKMPPFMMKKSGDKKAPAGKLCPGCKKPACVKAGKCMMKGK